MDKNGSRTCRGAPLGNTNAVKHGFYSKRFHRREAAALQDNPEIDLTAEITILRLKIRSLAELSRNETTFTSALNSLRAISFATICLTRLVSLQTIINPPGQPDDQVIRELLAWSKQIDAAEGRVDDPAPL